MKWIDIKAINVVKRTGMNCNVYHLQLQDLWNMIDAELPEFKEVSAQGFFWPIFCFCFR